MAAEDVEPPEVDEQIGGSLIEFIDQQIVPVPELLSWNEWQNWRRDYGLRPHRRSRRAESTLWKATMLELYGPHWLTEVHTKQFAEEEDEEYTNPPLRRRIPPEAPPTGAGVANSLEDLLSFDPVPASVPAQPSSPSAEYTAPVEAGAGRVETESYRSSADAVSVAASASWHGSQPGSPRSIVARIQKPYEPSAETTTEYSEKLDKYVAALRELGDSQVSPAAIEELKDRAQVTDLMYTSKTM